MIITLKIDNPHLEEQLFLFLKEQKQGLEEVTVEALQFFINAFRKNNIKKIDKVDLELKKEGDEFQELSNLSLAKIWDNKEDEVYDRFLR